ncbi:MAG TPA: MFS transporter [Candidatus Chromulinivoraceae bacterium]|nr:MFS transporter [Candidatus Chromulinivoraceae bacterium]
MKERSRWIILTLLALAQFMVVLDTSVANVALPAIQKTLGFDASTLQWVITAYALTFGGTLLLGGRAADLFGRRRTLLFGITGFTLISLLIGLSNSATLLIVLRALQGMSAAFMSPSALSIVLTTFREGKARNTALGVWTAVAAGGAAAGLVVGGLLTEYLNWRWNFFVNVPVGIFAAIGILKFVPPHSSTASHRHLDLPGALLVTSGLMTLVYGLTEAPHWGWLSTGTIGFLATSILLLVSFLWNESRASHPLMPLSIFKIRNVAGANAIMTPIMASMLGMFFLLSLYIQVVMKYEPVQAGIAFLPFPAMLAIISNTVPRLIPKYGYKRFLMIGTFLLAGGLVWLSQLTLASNYVVSILPAIILMAAGMGMSFVSVNIAATSGVPANEAGLASGMVNTSQQMGGALGLAVLSGVATSVAQGPANLGPVTALLNGDKRAFLVASFFALAAFLIASFVIREQPKTTQNTVVEPVSVH